MPILLLVLAACAPEHPTSWEAWREDGVPGEARPELPLPMLNELQAGNDSTATDERLERDDWVELYNPSEIPYDLAGFGLSDDPDEGPTFRFGAGVILPPGGHRVVWLDGQPEQGPDHADFRLDQDGDALALYAPDGQLVDAVDFGPQDTDCVLARFPDGTPGWRPSIRATPGTANPVDPGLSLDPSDGLFPEDRILRMELFLDPEQEALLRADRTASVRASFAFEGIFFADVDLRIKGAWGSARSIDQKAAFKIDLDDYESGRRLRGLEHLTLNNMVQDPTALHETLSYRMLRETGTPAPRTGHVELYLNGAYRGLYLHVETIDDTFLARWFADPQGNLYEGAYGADAIPARVGEMDPEQEGDHDDPDHGDLDALVAFLDRTPTEADWEELQRRVDVDALVYTLAVEIFIGHWDGYFYYPNNYRIYHDPSEDRWTLLMSGTDQTFAWRGGWTEAEADGRIADFCVQVPSCEQRLRLALWEVADRFADLDAPTWIDGAHARILDAFTRDPFREVSVDRMNADTASTRAYAVLRPGEITGALFPGGTP